MLERARAITRSSRVLIIMLMAVQTSSCGSGQATAADGMFHWTIATAIEIDAPPARVWEVLVDLPAYREWNPFIVEAAGTVAAGEKLALRMRLPGRSPMAFAPRLLVVEPERELRWKGRLLVPGLFDGEHSFVLTGLANGRTRLDHSERFAGLLLPIARRFVHEGTVQSFRALDAALARRAVLP
jgi:hypothetical protein